MPIVKRYANILLSLGSYVLAFVWYQLWQYGLGSYWKFLFPSPVSLILGYLTIFLIFSPSLAFVSSGIFFAVRSLRLKESSWAGTYLGIIGILSFMFILFITAFSLSWSHTSG